MTGAVDGPDEARRNAAGMNYLIAKPIEPEAIIGLFDKILGAANESEPVQTTAA